MKPLRHCIGSGESSGMEGRSRSESCSSCHLDRVRWFTYNFSFCASVQRTRGRSSGSQRGSGSCLWASMPHRHFKEGM